MEALCVGDKDTSLVLDAEFGFSSLLGYTLCFEELVLLGIVHLTFFIMVFLRCRQLQRHKRWRSSPGSNSVGRFSSRRVKTRNRTKNARVGKRNNKKIYVGLDVVGPDSSSSSENELDGLKAGLAENARHATTAHFTSPVLSPSHSAIVVDAAQQQDNSLKVFLSSSLAFIAAVDGLAYLFGLESFAPFQIIAAALSCAAWVSVTGVLIMERQSHCGYVHRRSWMVRFLFVFSLVGRALKFRSMTAISSQHPTQSLFYFSGLFLCTILTLIGLFHPSEQRDFDPGYDEDEVTTDVRLEVLERRRRRKLCLRERGTLGVATGVTLDDSSSSEEISSSNSTELDDDDVAGAALLQNFHTTELTRLPQYPQLRASWLSKLFFWWTQPMLTLGRKRALEEEDIFELPPSDTTETVSNVFDRHWRRQVRQGKRASLLKALSKSFGGQFLWSAVLKLGNDGSQFVGPIMLKQLMNWIKPETPNQYPSWWGWFCVAVIFLGQVLGAVSEAHYFDVVTRTGMFVRSALINSVFAKTLRLSPRARQRRNTGQITNLMANDTEQLQMIVQNLHLLWSSPLRIVVSLILLYAELGPASLAGVVSLMLMIPIQAKLVGKLGELRRAALTQQDLRLKLMNEILNGIRVLKFYTWEGQFYNKVMAVRELEWARLRKQLYVGAVNSMMIGLGPILVTVASFSIYAAMSELTPQKAFTALALFNVLRIPLVFLPQTITGVVQARVSLARLQDYLLSEERASIEHLSLESPDAVIFDRADFLWGEGDTQTFALSDVSLRIPRGALTMVVGPTGSGKSSFLNAILGELRAASGSVLTSGSMAFVPQQAWIFNSTIRENILFGKEYEAEKYASAIHASALTRDLSLFPARDFQELGERGANVSGGQKQRISIARAVYADADTILLDDCLSALDARVAREIFETCIGGTPRHKPVLAGKTRIMVTNQLHFLSACDYVVVVGDGAIVEHGKYDMLARDPKSAVSALMRSQTSEDNSGNNDDAADSVLAVDGGTTKSKIGSLSSTSTIPNASKSKELTDTQKGKLVSKEEREIGSVKSDVYKKYILAAGGTKIFVMGLGSLVAVEALRLLGSWLLSQWSGNAWQLAAGAYIALYAVASLIQTVFGIMKSIVFANGGLVASRTIHEQLLTAVLHAPMQFFDATPVGRILNRFSKDQAMVDSQLAPMLELFLSSVAQLMSTALLIVLTIPYTLIAFAPVLAAFYFVQAYYRHTSRELKRLDALSRSPLYSGFGETLDGLTTIRAFAAEDQMQDQLKRRLDINQRMILAGFCANRWLSLRIEFLGGIVVLAGGMFAVIGRNKLAPEIVGLALSYAFSITMLLMIITRFFTETEKSFNAVERALEYADVDPEAPADLDNDPGPEWPSNGDVEWKRASMRYRPNLPTVLRKVDIKLVGGEKVGVCGRTGAGKSTLFQSLFRLYEIDKDGGSILIDGIDVGSIGTRPLRRGIAIIPQEPVLFIGSIRWNLDPFDEHTDAELWHTLEASYLKDLVERLPGKLSAEISEGGSNLSVGQRQLLCLARAMLARCRILVVDEATANVDVHTDALIQATIRSEFATCTTLTIAHRLDTIIDSDRILVLDAGQVVEFDTPATLLSTQGDVGAFRALVDGTGPASARKLEDIAYGRAQLPDMHNEAADHIKEKNAAVAAQNRMAGAEAQTHLDGIYHARDTLLRAVELAVAGDFDDARRAGLSEREWRRALKSMIDDLKVAFDNEEHISSARVE